MDRLQAALKLASGTLSTLGAGPLSASVLAAPRVPAGLFPEPAHVVPRSRRRRKVGPVAVAAGCAIAVAGLVAFSELRQHAAPSASPAAGERAQVTPAASASASAVPTPTAKLHVETVPPGAKVKEEGETMCEATPCDIAYSGEGASPAFEHLLVFMKPDYKLERKLAKADGNPVTVRLTKAK
jgi:serine/threonine-protein kinase